MNKEHRLRRNSAPIDLYGLSHRMHYYKHLKDALEAHESKAKSISFRHGLLEHQRKANYRNELDRVHGYLSLNSSRLPIGTREKLNKRKHELQTLMKNIA